MINIKRVTVKIQTQCYQLLCHVFVEQFI